MNIWIFLPSSVLKATYILKSTYSLVYDHNLFWKQAHNRKCLYIKTSIPIRSYGITANTNTRCAPPLSAQKPSGYAKKWREPLLFRGKENLHPTSLPDGDCPPDRPRSSTSLSMWGLNENARPHQHTCTEAAQHFDMDCRQCLARFARNLPKLSKDFWAIFSHLEKFNQGHS